MWCGILAFVHWSTVRSGVSGFGRYHLRLVCCFVAASLLSGCADPSSSLPTDPPLHGLTTQPDGRISAAARPTLPGHLAGSLDQLRFGFQPSADGYEGASRGYLWQIDARGKLTLKLPSLPNGGIVQTPEPVAASFDTISIGRQRPQTSKPNATRVHRDGSVVIDRGIAAEIVRLTPRGANQSWSFARPIPGNGPLEIRVAVHGLNQVDAVPGGLLFAMPSSGATLRYGRATWIDGAGTRTALELYYDNRGAITISVDPKTLASSRYPAVLDPDIEVESVLETAYGVPDAPNTPAPGTQRAAAIAGNGQHFLIVWEDHRNEMTTIRGALVNESGALLEGLPCGFAISEKPGARTPDLAFNPDDDNYLVVWAGDQGRLESARVLTDATVLDSPAVELELTEPDMEAYAPRIAYSHVNDTGVFLVVYQRNPHGLIGPGLSAQFITADNTPGGRFELAPALAFADVAFDQDRSFMVAAATAPILPQQTMKILAQSVDAETGLLDDVTSILNVNEAAGVPTIATTAEGSLIVWPHQDVGYTGIRGRWLEPNGALGQFIDITTNVEDDAPAISDLANSFLVTWQRDSTLQGGSQICGAGFEGHGAPFPTKTFCRGTQATEPDIASGGSGYLVGWTETDSTEDIYVVSVPAVGQPGPTELVSRHLGQQTDAAVAFDSDNYLVVWSEQLPNSPNQVRAAIVDPDGLLQTPSTIILAESAPSEAHPAVAATSVGWLVVWNQNPEFAHIGYALVKPNGAIQKQGGVNAANDQTNSPPVVVCTSDQCLVLWSQSGHETGSLGKVVGCHVTNGGSTITEPFKISAANADVSTTYAPAAAVVPHGVLVVWTEDDSDDLDLYGALVQTNGSVSAPLPISTGPGDQTSPAVAGVATTNIGPQALVVWQDGRAQGKQVYGARVLSDGADGLQIPETDTSGIPISTLMESTAPAVIYSGDQFNYLVVWQGKPGGSSAEIYGAWVGTNGQVHEPNGVELTSFQVPVQEPALGADGQGRMLLAYHRYIHRYGTVLLRSLFVDSALPIGSPCSEPTACASRICDVEGDAGTCCSTACDVCETCAAPGDAGTCTTVVNADDDSCFDDVSCDGNGQCKTANGQLCVDADRCASGHCVDGRCCESACDNPCNTCTEDPGECKTISCTPFACTKGECFSSCLDTRQCSPGFQCMADQTCQPPRTDLAMDVGCGCRTVASTETKPPRPLGLTLLLAATAIWCRRQKFRRGSLPTGSVRRTRSRPRRSPPLQKFGA